MKILDARRRLTEKGLYDPRFEHDSCGVGFVCDVKGRKSRGIVRDGLSVLKRLAHRGAVGADPKTGDGAGILIQMPHKFCAKACEQEKIALPEAGHYGTGLVFLPTDGKERALCKQVFSKIITEENCALLGWRPVPTDNSDIGKTARESQPVIEQIFIGKSGADKKQMELERRLYVIRKRVENIVRASNIRQKSFFYITNLSCRTLSYKGLLMPHQLERFFPDLNSPDMESAVALVHSRYSTNTFPTWDLAQPFRFLAHNGEINTLRGNINWMQARQGLLESDVLSPKQIRSLLPVIVPGGSDSATLDNVFELLVLSGRSIAHAMTMLIPTAWEQDRALSKKEREFYQYHACLMEPWDGPAAIAFTDGACVGAVLDRNGLRPARYVVTTEDRVIMASEVGVLDIPPEKIKISGRLRPGRMLYINTEEGRIVEDDEIKKTLSARKPYGKWLKGNLVELNKLPRATIHTLRGTGDSRFTKEDILTLLKAFGYTREDLKFILAPMAETAQEPTGSMGNDTPHAVLSEKPQLLYTYFKQLFAQVTNPAIDPIREEIVMSLETCIGPESNLLDETARHAHKLRVCRPIISDEEAAQIRSIRAGGLKTKTISLLFDAAEIKDFKRALKSICKGAEAAISSGYSFICLSDRGVTKSRAALPALLAVGAVHHHLVRKALRTQIGIIVESAEPREVHHIALLFGYGADGVNPYLAYEAVRMLARDGQVQLSKDRAVEHYRKALEKGILKILSKMGISTLQSYRGAQIFEALGIGTDVIEQCFTGTVSRISGVGFDAVAREALTRHAEAFGPARQAPYLSTGGIYQWKRDGEFHLWNPQSIAALQDAARFNDYGKYLEFSCLINEQTGHPTTLRSVFSFKKRTPIPIDQVEPASEIFKRFATGAMSFGSISRAAHETLATAMNRLGGRSNTGEGGEDPARFTPQASGDSTRSAIKQVASGRFGVTINYLVNADELQIKIAQGAKPGEGGQLPGHKVSAIIARTRYTTPGVTLISPPPHHDIYSIEDLAQLIFDLKNANPRARISVKLVSEIGVGTIAAGVAKGHADMILISGGDGGTGASPVSSIRHAGLPWELGLSETHQTLVLNDLRSRVRLQTDGQMRTGRDVAVAALLGAEEFGFCTAALVVSGCVMLRHCHLNNCSVGVATQDELLEKRFRGRPEYIERYFHFVAEELRQIMAGLGVRRLDEMVGRTDFLEVNTKLLGQKAKAVDYSRILYRPDVPAGVGVYYSRPQDHGIDNVLDRRLIELARPALDKREPVHEELPIHNSNRTTGAMLSGEVCRLHGEDGLPDDTIHMKFNGVAGQSFGAFLAKGMTFELEGMANDYIGKGISGGRIIVYPQKGAPYVPEENILIGNTTFYGAIAGEAFIRGVAGERFCIRNSGLHAVVEGVGDHGCEYMTGGRVVVLGKTGSNFAAGMSGGIAYVYDRERAFRQRCNMSMVALERLLKQDRDDVRRLLHNHYRYTQSSVAKKILDQFEREIGHFVKVMPLEYKRLLRGEAFEKKLELSEVADG